MKFRIGQRVICTRGETAYGDLNGYYGHVGYLFADTNPPMVGVDLMGCTPEARRREELADPDVDHDDWLRQARSKPWPFFERELEAAD